MDIGGAQSKHLVYTHLGLQVQRVEPLIVTNNIWLAVQASRYFNQNTNKTWYWDCANNLL